jgi:hypothetical protein
MQMHPPFPHTHRHTHRHVHERIYEGLLMQNQSQIGPWHGAIQCNKYEQTTQEGGAKGHEA